MASRDTEQKKDRRVFGMGYGTSLHACGRLAGLWHCAARAEF
jgi:hypothetical protein